MSTRGGWVVKKDQKYVYIVIECPLIKVVQNIFFPETYNASTFLSLDSWCE